MSISEVVACLEVCGIDFDEIECGAYGVRVLKYDGEKEVPVFWVDEFEKLEEICESLMCEENAKVNTRNEIV